MKPNVQDRWLRLMANKPVTSVQEAELVAELESDADAWPQLVADYRMEGILSGMGHAAATEQEFLAATMGKWQAAHGGAAPKTPARRPSIWPRIWLTGALAATVALAAGLIRGQKAGRSASPPDALRTLAPALHEDLNQAAALNRKRVAAFEGESGAPETDGSVRILSLDFENGAVPDVLTTGGVVAGPPRQDNQFCAIGGVSPWTFKTNVVALTGGPQGLLGYHRNRSLRFRYWVGPEATRIVVQMKNLLQNQNHNAAIAPLVHGEWAWAKLPFTALEPFDQRRQMQDGDALIDILIMAGTIGRSPFYVDDIEIVEAREKKDR